MILRFKHRGLRRLYERGDGRALNPDHVPRIERILARLEIARSSEDMDLPGFRLHQLRGKLSGYWSVSVSGNWRIVFRFDGGDVTDVDYLDYH